MVFVYELNKKTPTRKGKEGKNTPIPVLPPVNDPHHRISLILIPSLYYDTVATFCFILQHTMYHHGLFATH